MNRGWSALAIFVSALLAGVVGAYAVATRVADREVREASDLYMEKIFDAEESARVPLATLRAASRGDMDTVIRFNCGLLKLEARKLYLLIRMQRDSRITDENLKKLYEASKQTVMAVEAQGKCSGPSWRTLLGEAQESADASTH